MRTRDVRIWADGDRLRYSAPPGVLTSDLRAALKRRKGEILAFLRENGAGLDSAPPLRPVPRDGELHLSFAQERSWFLSQWEPEVPAYNIAVALRARGRLDVPVLHRALEEITRRHEILRASCRVVGGRPLLAIAPDPTTAMETIDLASREGGDREDAFRRIAEEEARKPFDLSSGPMLRATVVRLDDDDHGLLFTTHHFVADGWSLGVLFRELTALYTAFRRGEPSPLPDLALHYADFAQWQRRCVEGGALQSELDYWRDRLQGAPALLQLPTDRKRPPEQRHRGATHRFVVPRRTREAVGDLARSEGVTRFMILLAAFQALLHRYTHGDDIVVGTAVSARNRTELEDLIGTFANNLVLRVDTSGSPSFRDLVARTREVAYGAYAHQEIPFERIIDELQPSRDLSHAPLFQVLFTLHQTAPEQNFELPGLDLSPVPVSTDTARFDLSLSLFEGPDRLDGELEYDTDLFEPDTVARIADHFLNLLDSAVAGPDRSISELPILTDVERRRLLDDWNATDTELEDGTSILDLFEAQVERAPEAVAVVYQDRSLTYRELDARAVRLANHLRRLGVRPEVLVGLCVDRSEEMLVALLAILKAGGAYVPLDPSYPSERLRFILEETRAPVLLTESHLLDDLPEHDARVVCLDTDREAWDRESDIAPGREVTAGNLAYVIYTSGSTGRPKGVQITHGSLANFLQSMSREPGVSEDDVLLAVTTISFDIAALELFLPICVGARVVIAAGDVAGDANRLRETLERSGVTVMQATPATWRMLVDAGWAGTEHLRVLSGGETLPRELARELMKRSTVVWNLYGPTETTIWSTLARVEPGEGSVPIGRPIANTRVYVLDPKGQLVPVGIPGELYIGGAGLARGYLKRPDQTSERFVPDPFSDDPADRLYRTGDWVRVLPDGRLDYLRRLDHQVKVRGFRIELAEIELALETHPGVGRAVTKVEQYGPGDLRLVAWFVPATGAEEPTGTDLRAYLRGTLPEYMVPSVLVPLVELPLTPNGKVDRNALAAPDLIRARGAADFQPPSSPTEIAMAEIWRAALATDRVGVADNFFDLGGHSLLSMQVIFQVEEELGVRLTPRDMVLNTLGQLAAHCDRERSQRPARSKPARRLWRLVTRAHEKNL